MKKVRVIAGLTAAIPAAVGGFAAPAAAHATQCRGLWVFDRLWVVPVFDYCG